MMSNAELDNNAGRVPVLLRSTSSPDATVEAVDMAVLTSLDEAQMEGQPDLIVELIDLYLQDTPHRLAAMQEALTRTDGLTLARAAHSLKGSSATLGAGPIASMCEELELIATAVKFEEAEVALAKLEREFSRVEKAFLAERERRCN
jgi:HPt (histidine-containing phosphotransfer) domain-containing protein